MAALALGALAISGAAARQWPTTTVTSLESDIYTATVNTSVYAAQATAPTAKFPKTNTYVKGKAFDRFITIWLENTDYDKAAEDPNLAWLATKGVTLTNYYGVTHPSEPNYVAAVGGDNFGMGTYTFGMKICKTLLTFPLLV